MSLFKEGEFGLAKERLPIFQAAADAYQWPPELEQALQAELGPRWMVWVLMAIDSRESRFGLLLDEDGLPGMPGMVTARYRLMTGATGLFATRGNGRTWPPRWSMCGRT